MTSANEVRSTGTRLSREELATWDADGYLLVRQMFEPDEVARGYEAVHQALRDGATTIAWHPSFTDRSHTVRIRNAIAQCPELAYFLDHPRLVEALVALLSESVQVLGTEIFVRGCQDEALEDWHIDGGEYIQQIRLAPGSQSLQLKCQIFLTDVSSDDSGNFRLIPGSHHRHVPPTRTCYLDDLNDEVRRGRPPEDAVTVRAAAGDVLFFPYSLWHAVGPNRRQPRTTLILRYGQLWHRPHDYLQQPAELLAGMSPRLRRMFGDLGADPHPLDFYKPCDQTSVMSAGDVPARHEPPS